MSIRMNVAATSKLMSLVAMRGIRQSEAALARAMERLATGKQINRASDDPSGMVASEAMLGRRREIEERVERYDLERHRLGAKEGALGVVSELVLELKGVVLRAANGGGMGEAELEALQVEADSIVDGLRLIASTATFNGEKLFGGVGSFGSYYVQNGEGIESMTLEDLMSGGALDLRSGDLSEAERLVEAAIRSNAGARAGIGARMREIESGLRMLAEEDGALAAEISRIVDTDYARETAEMVRAQVMRQAGLFAARAALDHYGQTVAALLAPARRV